MPELSFILNFMYYQNNEKRVIRDINVLKIAAITTFSLLSASFTPTRQSSFSSKDTYIKTQALEQLRKNVFGNSALADDILFSKNLRERMTKDMALKKDGTNVENVAIKYFPHFRNKLNSVHKKCTRGYQLAYSANFLKPRTADVELFFKMLNKLNKR